MQRINIFPSSWHVKSFMVRALLFMLIAVTLAFVSLTVAGHIQQINSTMDNSIYSSLENALKNLSEMVELTFEKDAMMIETVADGMSGEPDKIAFLKKLHSDSSVCSYFYAAEGEDIAYSPDGRQADMSAHEFEEHEDGFVRSHPFMTDKEGYAYLVRVPVMEDGRTVGYLYGEYLFSGLSSLLPMNVLNYSDVSVIDSRTLQYVYVPSAESLGMHINFQYLGSYISDDGKAQVIIDDVEEKMHDDEYAMNLVTFKNGTDYIMYMWPIGDGEYYLTGFAAATVMQKERASVQSTVRMIVVIMVCVGALIVAVLIILFMLAGRTSRQRAALQLKYNEELKSALAIAREANQAKSMFLSNMSHDIRTPMNAVVGFTTLLDREADDADKVRQYTKKISGASSYLLSIINDILDMSKIEAGNTTLSDEDFMLGDLVSSVESIIRPQAAVKSQEFVVRTSGIKHENVSGDETRVRQIIMNLLSNAVKYTQPGGRIFFSISGLPQKSPRIQRIRITVKDNGCGMTPEFIETLFDPFTRAENSTTNKIQGTGLGMAITKNIVDLMGGTIKVESEPDIGSTFTVELGLSVSAGSSDAEFWSERGIDRVFVVCEDEGLCGTIRSSLEQVDVGMDIARSCRQAAEAAERAGKSVSDYKVVLLDWNLAAKNKAELIRTVRESVSEDAVFLVMVYEWETVAEEVQAAGADGTISRNFFLSSLQERIIDIEELRMSGSSADNDGDSDMSSLRGLNILAAEDNELNAEILSEILAMFGARCEICKNGQEIYDRFVSSDEGEFDLILMDIQMPVMNGYEAARLIRACGRPDAASIPVIAMTANAFAEDIKDSLDAGMDAHVSKPVDINVLGREVMRLMEDKKR